MLKSSRKKERSNPVVRKITRKRGIPVSRQIISDVPETFEISHKISPSFKCPFEEVGIFIRLNCSQEGKLNFHQRGCISFARGISVAGSFVLGLGVVLCAPATASFVVCPCTHSVSPLRSFPSPWSYRRSRRVVVDYHHAARWRCNCSGLSYRKLRGKTLGRPLSSGRSINLQTRKDSGMHNATAPPRPARGDLNSHENGSSLSLGVPVTLLRPISRRK